MNYRTMLVSALLLSAISFARAADDEEAVTVFQRVSPSVVALESVASSGTGIIIDKDGTILTNAHVVAVPLPFKCLVDATKKGKAETVVFQRVKVVGVHPKLTWRSLRSIRQSWAWN